MSKLKLYGHRAVFLFMRENCRKKGGHPEKKDSGHIEK